MKQDNIIFRILIMITLLIILYLLFDNNVYIAKNEIKTIRPDTLISQCSMTISDTYTMSCKECLTQTVVCKCCNGFTLISN